METAFLHSAVPVTGIRYETTRETCRSEYLLIVHPDVAVGNKVMEEKQQFFDDYGVKTAIQTKPHIAIACFFAREAMEDTLIRWIQRICGQQKSFAVTLNNYSGLPPHTIYLRVQDPLPFQQLIRQLKPVDDFIQSSSCPPAKLIRQPYVSLAAELPEQVYVKAMPDYSRKLFHASFMVNEMLLLKKDSRFDTYKTVNVFRFLPPG